MKKHYIFMALYFIVMGTGLYVTYHVLNTSYNTPQFGTKFLPFMALLAVMVTIYRARFKNELTLPSPTKRSWYFVLPLIPIFVITVLSLSVNFAISLAYVLPIIDAILIVLAEEGLFRGVILGGLARCMKPIYAVLISSILFMSIHILNILAGSSIDAVANQLVTTLLMGLFLGALYIYTRNIIYPMFFHFAWDYIILSNGIAQISFAPITLIITAVLGILVLIAILWEIRNDEKLNVQH